MLPRHTLPTKIYHTHTHTPHLTQVPSCQDSILHVERELRSHGLSRARSGNLSGDIKVAKVCPVAFLCGNNCGSLRSRVRRDTLFEMRVAFRIESSVRRSIGSWTWCIFSYVSTRLVLGKGIRILTYPRGKRCGSSYSGSQRQ
jgi:hypothetical protein